MLNFKNLAARIFRIQSPALDRVVWRIIEAKMANGYKFTYIQKRWLSTLLAFPERQYRKGLGRRDENGVESFCCLGQAAMLVVDKADYYWTPNDQKLALRNGENLKSIFLLNDSTRDAYNFYSCDGEFESLFGNIGSLAQMNDHSNYTWTDLAWYVIENPHNVFAS